MKVIHIIKKIETVDEDIKELRKLEKSLVRDKSFSTPIYISIEKQINILLDSRIKLLGLKIANPPADLLKDIEEEPEEETEEKKSRPAAKKAKPRKEKTSQAERHSPSEKASSMPRYTRIDESEETDEISILTQDFIDDRFSKLKQEKDLNDRKLSEKNIADDESIKLLDVALEKGSLSKDSLEKERKKVRFFKDNFPGGEY